MLKKNMTTIIINTIFNEWGEKDEITGRTY